MFNRNSNSQLLAASILATLWFFSLSCSIIVNVWLGGEAEVSYLAYLLILFFCVLLYFSRATFFFSFRIYLAVAYIVIFVLAYMNMEYVGHKASMTALTVGSNLLGFFFGYMLLSSRNSMPKIFYAALTLMTFSRLALLALLVAYFVRGKLWYLMILGCALFLIYYFYSTAQTSSLAGFRWVFRLSDSGRLDIYSNSFATFFEAPFLNQIFGYGPGNFGESVYHDSSRYAHNVFIQSLIEIGIVGLFSIFFLFFCLYRALPISIFVYAFIVSNGETLFENYVIILSFATLFFFDPHARKQNYDYGAA